jgi:hypothetical protein
VRRSFSCTAPEERYRESSGCHPVLHVLFFPSYAGEFVEFELDESCPQADVVSAVWHLWEVTRNAVTGKTTDQPGSARMLDKRFQS